MTDETTLYILKIIRLHFDKKKWVSNIITKRNIDDKERLKTTVPFWTMQSTIKIHFRLGVF